MKDKKASHKDPDGYTVIASLNPRREATLTMTCGKQEAVVELGEGDMYILSGPAAERWYHDLSPPHGGKDRIALVLRYVKEEIIEKAEAHVAKEKAEKAEGESRAPAAMEKGSRSTRPRTARLMG